MGVFDDTVISVWNGFSGVLTKLAMEIPNAVLGVLLAAFFIVLGWIAGNLAKKVLIEILKFGKLDEWAKQHNLKDAVGGVHLSHLAGSFLKYYVFLLFLQQAVDSVQLNSLKVFLGAVVYFIPYLLFALAVFVLGLLLAKFVKNKIEATHHAYKKTIASVTELVIIYLSLILALERIGMNTDILKNAFLLAFGAFVLVVALVFGISMALAFKKEAKQIAETIKKEMRELE